MSKLRFDPSVVYCSPGVEKCNFNNVWAAFIILSSNHPVTERIVFLSCDWQMESIALDMMAGVKLTLIAALEIGVWRWMVMVPVMKIFYTLSSVLH